MYEQAFDRIDDLLRTTTCQTELDYIEQTSWLLFLKYLDGQEKEAETTANAADRVVAERRINSLWGDTAAQKSQAGQELQAQAVVNSPRMSPRKNGCSAR